MKIEKSKGKCFICGKRATQNIDIDSKIKDIPLCDNDNCYNKLMEKIFKN